MIDCRCRPRSKPKKSKPTLKLVEVFVGMIEDTDPKRSNFNSRTVISPDPTLSISDVGIPEDVAKILTVPERVTRFNLEKLKKLMADGKVSFLIKHVTNTRFNLKYVRNPLNRRLEIGDVVERQMMNGDMVFLNRQPSLSAGSMLAQRVIIRKPKTFSLPIAICKSFNADSTSGSEQ